MATTSYKFVRLIRTPSSEVYLLWDGIDRVGQADIHYCEGFVHCTILVEESLSRDEIDAIVNQLDEDVVSSYLPGFERDDFFVNVFSGEELLSYSDTEDDDDGDTEDE